ncbi:imidazolonepropionase [bacterium]|nr:imidazolonepropionase [bacterium]
MTSRLRTARHLPRCAGLKPEMVVRNIGQLATLDHPDGQGAKGPLRGPALDDPVLVAKAALVCGGGCVLATGPEDEVLGDCFAGGVVPEGVAVFDAAGCAVVPGFVDPHTHLVFGKTRQDEYERRIRGETYLEIAAAGGGIHSSVADLRGRSLDELADLATARMLRMLSHGTTTAEVKSGYGLSLDDEIRMLRAAGIASQRSGLGIVRTCLAAHEVPREFRGNRDRYVALVVDEILPGVVEAGLAERCDVFCEPSVFDLEESRAILTRARELGLGLTVHADELEPFGGAALAAELGADSADHLIRIDEAGRAALAASDTVAVFLPGTVFTLGLRQYAPARAMIDEGCAVALATDFNPGSCPIYSVPLIMAIACTQMRLTPAESLAAATLNAAWALGRQAEVGSLACGKWANFLVLDGDDYRLVPYAAGHNPVRAVFRGGVRIYP